MPSKADYWRQLKIFNPSKHRDIKIAMIGAGSVGSFTALVLAKMGLTNITVWDDDVVENHNIPNQMYPITAIGQKKTSTLFSVLGLMAGGNPLAIVSEKWTSDTDLDAYDIILACTDDMTSRKAIWEACKFKPHKTFIDARMGGEMMLIYTIDPMSPKQVKGYESTLYDDDKAEDMPCDARTIVYNMAGIAGFIANNVKKVLTNDKQLHHEIVFDYKTMLMETRSW